LNHAFVPVKKRSVFVLWAFYCANLHHLIPKKLHRRAFYRKKFDRETLNRGVNICRLCHDGIHDLYDEMQLAKQFSSAETLLADEALQRHFAWVAKKK